MTILKKLNQLAIDALRFLFGATERRREKLRNAPFSSDWEDIVVTNCPFYQKLSADEQKRLQQHIKVFLAEKRFEGCNGLEICDEIRVTIAAQACLLILNHQPPRYYPRVSSILVYPGAFKASVDRITEAGTLDTSKQAIIGQAWTRDLVILSWNDVLRGSLHENDGYNVVFHEFAHQLDAGDGDYDGVPILSGKSLYSAWVRVFSSSYERLRRDINKGKATFLDAYGATNSAEFFAVATEHFFEEPVQFKKRHRDLYELLKVFYQQDPSLRVSPTYATRKIVKKTFSLPAYLDVDLKALKNTELSDSERELKIQVVVFCAACLVLALVGMFKPLLFLKLLLLIVFVVLLGNMTADALVLVHEVRRSRARHIIRSLKKLDVSLVEGELRSGVSKQFYADIVANLPALGFEKFVQFTDANLQEHTGIDYETVFRSDDNRTVVSFAHQNGDWRDLVPFLRGQADHLSFFTMFSDGSDLTSTTNAEITEDERPPGMRVHILDEELSLEKQVASHRAEVARIEASDNIRVKRFLRQATFLKFLRRRARKMAKFLRENLEEGR